MASLLSTPRALTCPDLLLLAVWTQLCLGRSTLSSRCVLAMFPKTSCGASALCDWLSSLLLTPAGHRFRGATSTVAEAGTPTCPVPATTAAAAAGPTVAASMTRAAKPFQERQARPTMRSFMTMMPGGQQTIMVLLSHPQMPRLPANIHIYKDGFQVGIIQGLEQRSCNLRT